MSFTISRIIAVFLATAIFALQSTQAAEIDSVIPRRIHLDDSLEAINEIFNQRMMEGIAKANGRRDDIDKDGKEYVCTISNNGEKKSYEQLTDDEKKRCTDVNYIVGTERW